MGNPGQCCTPPYYVSGVDGGGGGDLCKVEGERGSLRKGICHFLFLHLWLFTLGTSGRSSIIDLDLLRKATSVFDLNPGLSGSSHLLTKSNISGKEEFEMKTC